MKIYPKPIIVCFLLIASLYLASCAEKRILNPPSFMIGKWHGNADFYPVPVKQQPEKFNVEYEFAIEPDGRVTGFFGNAKINESFVVRTSDLLIMLGNGEYRSNLTLTGRIHPSKDYYDADAVLFIGEVIDDKMIKAGMNCYTHKNGKRTRIMSNVFPLKDISESQ